MIPGMQQAVMNAFQYSLFYLIFSLPLTLSYRTTKVINFAHANFITYGAYVAIFLHGILGLNLMSLAVIVAFALTGSIAVINNELVFTPLQKRGLTSYSDDILNGFMDSLQVLTLHDH